MRLLHTSDWHLGKRLDDFSRCTEQQAVLDEICELADREVVDVILVAGDLFDTFNPPTEAIDLLYKTLKRLTNNGRRPVIAIAGNHDSPDRIEAPDPLARECGIIFAGYPDSAVTPFDLETGLKVLRSEPGFVEVQLPDQQIPLRILYTPYASEFRLKSFLGIENREEELQNLLQARWQDLADKYCTSDGINVAMVHLFMARRGDEWQEEPEDEKPILHVGGAQVIYSDKLPCQLQYAALGHLHRMQAVDKSPCPVYYSGSILSYSFAEANQQKYVLMVDVEPDREARITPLRLTQGKPLLRWRAEGIDAALQWLGDHPDALVELTLVTENFLSARERRQLLAAYSGIVTIIPEVSQAGPVSSGVEKQIDLSKSMEELFCDFFKHEKGKDPDEDILSLFNEMLAEEV